MSALNCNYINVTAELKKAVEDFIDEWNNTELYITTRTSGSTGKPKEIRILKSRMEKSAHMTGEFLQLKKNKKAVLCLSPSTIGGKMMIVRAIVLNLELIVIPVDGNPLAHIQADIDFIAMAPLQLYNSLTHTTDKLKKIPHVIIGGGVISAHVEKKLKNECITIFHTYGMTETISHVAMRKVGLASCPYFTAIGENYFSLHNNLLVIHSPLLDSDSIITNDIVELIDTKNFIFKGRIDFVINSGGIKIHPEAVEQKLESFIQIDFFITGLKDEHLGEKVVLFIESSPYELDKKDLLNYVSKYECPKEIYFLKEFVRTESGKINRPKTINLLSI